MCGFALTQQGTPSTVPPGQYPAPPPLQGTQQGQPPPQPHYPTQEAPRQYSAPSVLQALRVGRPAKGQFWFGLALLLVVLVCCPCSLGVLIFGSDAVADPGGFVSQILLIGLCLFAVGAVLGIILMVVGRPRRMQ
ncbi:MAG: hypothetical protein M3437_04085 [Chloroflexota bacterium]|nr:hypothetical protein [Chloroflexota bacterium]MDQ5864203.1 hypothetical protein [Chloroflexota bacterium]